MSAISGLDIALWDLKGKRLGMYLFVDNNGLNIRLLKEFLSHHSSADMLDPKYRSM